MGFAETVILGRCVLSICSAYIYIYIYILSSLLMSFAACQMILCERSKCFFFPSLFLDNVYSAQSNWILDVLILLFFFGNAWEINQLPNQVTTLECQQSHFKTDKTINGRERMKIHFPTKPSRSQQGGILNLCDAPWAKGSEVFKPCWGWELLLILLSLLLNSFCFNGLFVVERFLVSIKFEEIFYTSVSSYFCMKH